MRTFRRCWSSGCLLLLVASCALLSAQEKAVPPEPVSEETLRPLVESRDSLRSAIESLRTKPGLETRDGEAWLADVGVFEKAATWMLRFQEFPKADYIDQLRNVLKKGTQRAEQLKNGKADWSLQPGMTIRGYVSTVDGSVQPYALTLPEGMNPQEGRRWPLHVVLHGRADHHRHHAAEARA